MIISSQLRTLLCAGIAGALSFAVPALAQSDEQVPACSATVTDHCMQRQGGARAVHHAMTGHHAAKRHHHRHHRLARKAHRHHAAPAKEG